MGSSAFPAQLGAPVRTIGGIPAISLTLVYIPVLSWQDIEGKTFRPMALIVMLAQVSALFVTPRARRGYTPMPGRAMGHPWRTAGLAAALLAVSAA